MKCLNASSTKSDIQQSPDNDKKIQRQQKTLAKSFYLLNTKCFWICKTLWRSLSSYWSGQHWILNDLSLFLTTLWYLPRYTLLCCGFDSRRHTQILYKENRKMLFRAQKTKGKKNYTFPREKWRSWGRKTGLTSWIMDFNPQHVHDYKLK